MDKYDRLRNYYKIYNTLNVIKDVYSQNFDNNYCCNDYKDLSDWLDTCKLYIHIYQKALDDELLVEHIRLENNFSLLLYRMLYDYLIEKHVTYKDTIDKIIIWNIEES